MTHQQAPSPFFELQPRLRGELLSLRPLRAEDFKDLYAVAADPLIWEQHPDNNRYQEDVFKDFFRTAMDSGGALAVLDASGRIIGSSRFHGFDKSKNEIEIGWTFLARNYWGGVYNREMKQLMLQHAFKYVNSVIFVVGRHNIRSQKAIEKVGAVHIGMRLDARRRESFVYQITAAAYAKAAATGRR